MSAFRGEGVFHEMEAFTVCRVTSLKMKKKKNATLMYSIPSIAPVPGFSNKLSQTLDPEDATTLRSRVIQFKYLKGDAGVDDFDDVLWNTY
ncbi:hypothetical protein BDQ17DRAFT_1372420 [Cyathus striatus]|nr:hypothetical protein BDQ17DRAFT_1372420 [Cyathus striatus]